MKEESYKEKLERDIKSSRLKSISGGSSVVHANSSINVLKFMNDKSDKAETARRFAAMKPKY